MLGHGLTNSERNVLDVVVSFGDDPEPLTPQVIAEETGYAIATVRHAIASLRAAGLVKQRGPYTSGERAAAQNAGITEWRCWRAVQAHNDAGEVPTVDSVAEHIGEPRHVAEYALQRLRSIELITSPWVCRATGAGREIAMMGLGDVEDYPRRFTVRRSPMLWRAPDADSLMVGLYLCREADSGRPVTFASAARRLSVVPAKIERVARIMVAEGYLGRVR